VKHSYLTNDLDEAQCDLVMRSRDFVNANDSSHSSAANPDLYLNSWARVRGNARLRILQTGMRGIPYYCVRWLADFKGYVTKGNMACVTPKVWGQKYRKIALSWGMFDDFDDNGIYLDRYLGTSSRESQETLWLIMYSSKVKPRVLDRNIMLLYWPKKTFFESLLKFVSTVVSPTKMSLFSSHSCREISDVVIRELSCNSLVEKVILPYEAQPFQQTLFECIKRDFPGVASVGYLHSAPPPLPTDLLYRKSCPSNLMVHGEGVKEMLCELLNWPLETVTVIKSLRYNEASSKNYNNEILLPYSFENPDRILESIRLVVERSLLCDAHLWRVRNHPVQYESAVHLNLEESINQIIRSAYVTDSGHDSRIKRTVMIGATAAILEALEQGLEVIHIVSNPLLEAHSSSIWRRMDVERLGEYVFLYRMNEVGKYIKMGDSSTSFATIFG
jgi:hypothetical protein